MLFLDACHLCMTPSMRVFGMFSEVQQYVPSFSCQPSAGCIFQTKHWLLMGDQIYFIYLIYI